jgi:hypothetical protein
VKVYKDDAVDCTASAYWFELSCDLRRNHPGSHWDDEYGVPFYRTSPGYQPGNYAPDAYA